MVVATESQAAGPGSRFGRLVVQREAGRNRVCRCDCGSTKTVRSDHLRSGAISSCGCLARELQSARAKTHGLSRSPEHYVWMGMKSRCYCTSDKNYPKYGARGIRVCDRWRESFEAFLADMGTRPSPEHSIERRENDGHYEPGNCYWATRSEQARNKRTTRLLTIDGVTKPLAEWAETHGLKYHTLQRRRRMGETGARLLRPVGVA